MSAYTAVAFPMTDIPRREVKSSVTGRARPINERDDSRGHSLDASLDHSLDASLDDIDALVRVHRARLLRFITFSTGDPDLAETVAQDALLRAYNGRESFRGECSVSTWLTGIAINVLRDHQRTERYKFWKKVRSSAVDVSEMAGFLPSEQTSPEKQLLAKEKVKHLARVLETLSPNQRTIFLMKFTEDMAVGEICEALGMAEATVRTHLHRALTAVRSQLGATI